MAGLDLQVRRRQALEERQRLIEDLRRSRRVGREPADAYLRNAYLRKKPATTVPVQAAMPLPRGRTRTPTRSQAAVAVPVVSPFLATTVIPESPEVRFVDAAVNAGVAGASVLWTATRPTLASQLGWAAFWMLLGGLMAVEGTAELRYAGFGVSAANASFLGLRIFHPVLTGS
jgi:hypothetical protein